MGTILFFVLFFWASYADASEHKKRIPVKDRHSARNNMRCNNEILCAGCTKCDAHGAHVVHKHIWTSLVYTLQCHSYTTFNVTIILSSMSLIYSLLCQGYTRSCLRAFLTSAYEVRISNQVVTRAKTMTKEEHENNKKGCWMNSIPFTIIYIM